MRKDYKVYDPKTDTLKFLNEGEHQLIVRLQESEEIRLPRTLNDYIDRCENKPECLDRLDEITNFIYRHIRAFDTEKRMVYFLDKPHVLLKVIEILESFRNEKSPVESQTNDSKAGKKINIDNNFIQRIAEAFEGKLNCSTDQLKSVLNGQSSPQKIIFRGPAIQLIGSFWMLNDVGLINDSKDVLALWLCETFQYTKKGQALDMNLGTVNKGLGGQSNSSSKEIRGIKMIVKEIKHS